MPMQLQTVQNPHILITLTCFVSHKYTKLPHLSPIRLHVFRSPEYLISVFKSEIKGGFESHMSSRKKQNKKKEQT